MVVATEDLFAALQFRLPYVDDKSNEEKEATARSEFSKALNCVGDISMIESEDELIHVITLLAVNLERHPWNDHKIVTKACQYYQKLRLQHSPEDSLLRTHPKLCLWVNKLIRSTLTRDTWQDNALVCYLYKWYCHELQFPTISDYLDVLLPPSLNLVDSYDDELKVMGVKCLYHIMNESGRAELRWYGRAQVIYQAFQKLSYTKYEPLITVLHPAIIKVLKVLEGDPTVSKGSADEVYQMLLSDMYLEDKLVLRRAYANSMKLYAEYLQTNIIKHLKQTMKITLNYLEDSCGSAELTRLTMLEVLQVILGTAKPRINSYHVEMTKILLRLVVDTVHLRMETDIRSDIISKVTSIFKQIQQEHESKDYIIPSLQLLMTEFPIRDKDSKGRLLLNLIQQMQSCLT